MQMIFPHFRWRQLDLKETISYLSDINIYASHHLETQATTSATGKTNCAVLESCFTSPFTCTTPANQ